MAKKVSVPSHWTAQEKAWFQDLTRPANRRGQINVKAMLDNFNSITGHPVRHPISWYTQNQTDLVRAALHMWYTRNDPNNLHGASNKYLGYGAYVNANSPIVRQLAKQSHGNAKEIASLINSMRLYFKMDPAARQQPLLPTNAALTYQAQFLSKQQLLNNILEPGMTGHFPAPRVWSMVAGYPQAKAS